MDFGLSEEQQMLKKSARDLLEKECPPSVVRQMETDDRGYLPEMWERIAGLGWVGLPFPSQYGGGDGSFMDLVVLVSEIGRCLLPAPYLSTVTAGLHIVHSGTPQQKEQYLPDMCGGRRLASLAIDEPGGSEFTPEDIHMEATQQGRQLALSGTKLWVPFADSAHLLLVVARKQGALSTFLVDARQPGLEVRALKTMAGDHYGEVNLNQVVVSSQEVLGDGGNVWREVERVLLMHGVLLCAYMLGGAERVLERTVDYSRQRVQFGRPIGSMQALQHHCADMSVSIEAAWGLTNEAAWRISEGVDFAAEASMAKSFTSECYTRCTQLAMMIQGGVAFMEDHELPLYYRRAKALEVMQGDPDAHGEMVARQILD